MNVSVRRMSGVFPTSQLATRSVLSNSSLPRLIMEHLPLESVLITRSFSSKRVPAVCSASYLSKQRCTWPMMLVIR